MRESERSRYHVARDRQVGCEFRKQSFVSLLLSPTRDGLGCFRQGKHCAPRRLGIYRHEEEFNPYALAASTAQGYKTTQLLGTNTSTLSFDSIDSQSPINPPDFSVYTLNPSDTTRPIYYEYNGAISQRLPWWKFKGSLVEVAYVGANSQHLSSYNSQAAGYNESSDVNVIPAGFFFQTGNQSILGEVPGSPYSIGSLNTNQQDFFRPLRLLQSRLFAQARLLRELQQPSSKLE